MTSSVSRVGSPIVLSKAQSFGFASQILTDAARYLGALAAAPAMIEVGAPLVIANPTPMSIVGGALSFGVCAFLTANTVGNTLEDLSPLVPKTPQTIKTNSSLSADQSENQSESQSKKVTADVAKVGTSLSFAQAYVEIGQSPSPPLTLVGKILAARKAQRHGDDQQTLAAPRARRPR